MTTTGLTYTSLDFVKLFDAIEALKGQTTTPGGGGSPGPTGTTTPAVPAAGEAQVTLAEGQNLTGVNFENFLTGTISGTVFLDSNSDGRQDNGEAGLAGVTVYLDTAGAGTLLASDPQVVTDASGHFTFTGLAAGNYVVREVVPTGDLETTPDPVAVSITSGKAATAQFGLFGSGSIGGTVFLDANDDGVQDNGEIGLSGVTVFIDKASTGVLANGDPQTTTDGAGDFTFGDLGPGSYLIREVVPTGDVETTPDPVSVTITSGIGAAVNFGLFETGAISGAVFDDVNSNGTQETNEVGLSGRTVFIDAAHNGVLTAGDPEATTNAAGHYAFTDLGPGTYVVREVPEPDATGTTADPVTVNMTSGLAATVNFGLHFNGPALSASGPPTATIGQPYTIQLGATDPLHTISEWMINWGDNTVQDFAGNPTQASHTYLIGAKTYTIVASATDDTGTYTAAPIAVTVGAPLQVVSVTPNVSGVDVRFNDVINAASIHLYDAITATHTSLLPPDVTLVGAKTGAVAGSLVFDPDLKGLTFIKTGAPLAADTYTLTLLSGAAGFQDPVGALDGLDTGAPGSGNYVTTFTVSPSTAAILTMPDIIAGPTQPVNYAINGNGLPLTLTNAAGITSLSFHVDYDPTLLTITGALSIGAPAGSTLVANVSTPGHATFVFTAASGLGAGPITIGAITATVPSSAVYGTRQVIKIAIDSVSGGAAIAGNALEVVGFLGDADGNAKYDADDVTLLQRVIVKSDSGFAAWPDVDPVIIADVLRRGALDSSDATLVSRQANGIALPQYFAPLPSGAITPNPTVLATGLAPITPVNISAVTARPSLSRTSFAGNASEPGSGARPLVAPFPDYAPSSVTIASIQPDDGSDQPDSFAIDDNWGGGNIDLNKRMKFNVSHRWQDFSLAEPSNAAPSWKRGFVATLDKKVSGLSGIRVTL